MKVLTDTKPAFKPVTIVLETQGEVDELYSWVNHGTICPPDSPLDGLHDELFRIASSSHCAELNRRLEEEFKPRK